MRKGIQKITTPEDDYLAQLGWYTGQTKEWYEETEERISKFLKDFHNAKTTFENS